MKVILYMAMTLNGYIAKENDDTSWVSDVEWVSFEKMAKTAGSMIIGRRTYEIMKEEDSFPNDCFVVVISGSLKEEGVTIAKSPEEALEVVSQKGFETVIIAGGAENNTNFLKANLVDEIYLDVEPVVLGKGIQLFKQDDFEVKLKLLEINKLNAQTVQLHYKVQND